jgi:hypothetical protein
VFTRADTTEIVFPSSAGAYVWCGEYDGEYDPSPALHIAFAAPGEDTYWSISAIVANIEIDQPITIPATGISIFLNDPPNELSSGQSESSGTISFYAIPCPDGNWVDFSIDAVLGSELHLGPSVAVSGYFRHNLTPLPTSAE